MTDIYDKFRHLSREERIARLSESSKLTSDETLRLSGQAGMSFEIAEHLIENVVGYFPLPMGVATHFRIDGRDLFIPMAVEESSIIASASATAKWVRSNGSIQTFMKGHLIIGQIQLPQVEDVGQARKKIENEKQRLIQFANKCLPGLVARGGGVTEIVIREIERPTLDGTMLVLHVLCNPCDAMGANLINQVCEALKPEIQKLTGEKVGLCILSNLVDTKLVGAEVRIRDVDPELAIGIEEATLFALADPYRATTHNKGVLNGIDPILIATGNDWRAVSAGVHAYAARTGQYRPITHWRRDGSDLLGSIEIPLSLGIQGGMTRIHPTSQVVLKILQVQSSEDLARICAAVGLVQNLGALKALSTVGIVKGHMQLHAANLAIAAGADGSEIYLVRDQLAHVLETERSINLSRAKEILEALRVGANSV